MSDELHTKMTTGVGARTFVNAFVLARLIHRLDRVDDAKQDIKDLILFLRDAESSPEDSLMQEAIAAAKELRDMLNALL